jgi:hypothetical protein
MREKLNENPMVQAAAIGVLALVVGVVLLMRMGGGSEAAPEPAASGQTTVINGTAAPVDPAAAAATATATATDPAAATAAATGAEFKAGPGLPAQVVDAYEGGQAVALLIVNARGIDDRELTQTVATLGSRAGVAVFVTDVKDVADYSRITQGADLDRTPALIVMRPKRFSDGSAPTVSVSYGFRGPESVQQAFDDALYEGPSDLPSYP